MENQTTQRKAVYSVIDREGKKAFWHLLGTAFVCKDGSLDVHFDSLPLNGRVNIRDFKENSAK